MVLYTKNRRFYKLDNNVLDRVKCLSKYPRISDWNLARRQYHCTPFNYITFCDSSLLYNHKYCLSEWGKNIYIEPLITSKSQSLQCKTSAELKSKRNNQIVSAIKSDCALSLNFKAIIVRFLEVSYVFLRDRQGLASLLAIFWPQPRNHVKQFEPPPVNSGLKCVLYIPRI